GLDDARDHGRVAVHVTAPVLTEHEHVLDLVDPAEELPLVLAERGLAVVLLRPGARVAHLGHVVLPGHAFREASGVQGNRQLGHVVLSSVCRLDHAIRPGRARTGEWYHQAQAPSWPSWASGAEPGLSGSPHRHGPECGAGWSRAGPWPS